jgi:hypothetical protein
MELVQIDSIACEHKQYRRRSREKSMSELFLQESPVVVGSIARDTRGSFKFLAARVVGSTVSNGDQSITRGFNYGNDKARNLIKVTKQLIVFKYCELQDRQLDDIEKRLVAAADMDP